MKACAFGETVDLFHHSGIMWVFKQLAVFTAAHIKIKALSTTMQTLGRQWAGGPWRRFYVKILAVAFTGTLHRGLCLFCEAPFESDQSYLSLFNELVHSSCGIFKCKLKIGDWLCWWALLSVFFHVSHLMSQKTWNLTWWFLFSVSWSQSFQSSTIECLNEDRENYLCTSV